MVIGGPIDDDETDLRGGILHVIRIRLGSLADPRAVTAGQNLPAQDGSVIYYLF